MRDLLKFNSWLFPTINSLRFFLINPLTILPLKRLRTTRNAPFNSKNKIIYDLILSSFLLKFCGLNSCLLNLRWSLPETWNTSCDLYLVVDNFILFQISPTKTDLVDLLYKSVQNALMTIMNLLVNLHLSMIEN